MVRGFPELGASWACRFIISAGITQIREVLVKLSDKERLQLHARSLSFGKDISESMGNLKQTLAQLSSPFDEIVIYEALAQVKVIKKAIQEVHDLNHELACLAAKVYLVQKYRGLCWDDVLVLDKDVNASGPDLLVSQGNHRLVGEVKTTEPIASGHLCSNQKDSITKDCEKLSSATFDGYDRYMFMADSRAYCIVKDVCISSYPKVQLVLLTAQPTI